MFPWKQDFEEDNAGNFLIEGNWKLSHRESARAEPGQWPDDWKYIYGELTGGQSTFDKARGQAIFSFLPPVDLSGYVTWGFRLFLSQQDMYVGFTG